MSEEKLALLVKSCSYLSDLMDNLALSEDLPLNSDDLQSTKELASSLYKMSIRYRRTSDKIVLIPEKLIIILNNLKDGNGQSNKTWYYCDSCYVSTTSSEVWSSHSEREKHTSKYPETLIHCRICGLCMYGLEENLYGYINSPSHKATDYAIFSKTIMRESHVIDSACNEIESENSLEPWVKDQCSEWKRIKKYHVLMLHNNSLKVYPSINDAVKIVGFKVKGLGSQHNFTTLCQWIDSCFPMVMPVFQCDLCKISPLPFNGLNLWKHLTSQRHKDANRRSGKIGLGVCPHCQRVFIDYSSNLASHSHCTATPSLTSFSVGNNNKKQNTRASKIPNKITSLNDASCSSKMEDNTKITDKFDCNDVNFPSSKTSFQHPSSSGKEDETEPPLDDICPDMYKAGSEQNHNVSASSSVTITKDSSSLTKQIIGELDNIINSAGSRNKVKKVKSLSNNVSTCEHEELIKGSNDASSVARLLDMKSNGPEDCTIVEDTEKKSLIDCFNYMLDRFSLEPFCCITVYYCSICNYRTAYVLYWEHHLLHHKPKKQVDKSNQYTIERCLSCGLTVFIKKSQRYLLDLPVHASVDSLFTSQQNEDSLRIPCPTKCRCVIDIIQKGDETFRPDDMSHQFNICDCPQDWFEQFLMRNFTLTTLQTEFNRFLAKCIQKNIKCLQFTCYDCEPFFSGVYSEFEGHMTNDHQATETNPEMQCKGLNWPVMNVAGFCRDCDTMLVVNSPETIDRFLLEQQLNECEHRQIRTSIKNIFFLRTARDPDHKKFSLPISVREESVNPTFVSSAGVSVSKMLESLKLIFKYLLSRYRKEPFCHDCGTYYYCSICSYKTSYWFYWKSHLAGNKHNGHLKALDKSCFISHHCSLCGLTIFTEKDKIKYLDSPEHQHVDDILKLLVPGDNDFLANCEDVLPKLEERNSKFLGTILHCPCKEKCEFKRSLHASQICNRQPFILINYSLVELSNKFKWYTSQYSEILKSKKAFICLDCESITYHDKLTDLKVHLINEHELSYLESEKCLRRALFCSVCCSLMISCSYRCVTNVFKVNSEKRCDHTKLLDNMYNLIANLSPAERIVSALCGLEKQLINSNFKCSVLKNTVSYSCCLCSLVFRNLKELRWHILLPGHTSMYENMIIFFCYDCIKIEFLSDRDTSGACVHFFRIFKGYRELKREPCKPSPSKSVSQKIKVLPDVTVERKFSFDLNYYLSYPVITSHYEHYKLIDPFPKDDSSVSSSAHSPVIYRDVDISLLNKLCENRSSKPNDLNYLCLICEENFEDSESLLSHLTGKNHIYHCHFVNQSQEKIPLMIFCETCSLCVIAASVNSLEEHFQFETHLKMRRETKMTNSSSLEDHELWCISNLSEECLKKFHSEQSLKSFLSGVMTEIDSATKFYLQIKDRLVHDLMFVLSPEFPRAKVYFFGSRETGLAKKESDIDIFIDLGDYYMEECKKVKNYTAVVSGLFRKSFKAFEWRSLILATRVPLVKLWHKYFSINIDVSCLNSNGTENSKLLRFYLNFDQRCRWLATVFKEWATMNFLRHARGGFNSYTLVWMVLFFLMQPDIGIIPTVLFLKSQYKGPSFIINGWDYSYSLNEMMMKKKFTESTKSKNLSQSSLLKKFFSFYSNLKTDKIFLCPLSGKVVPVNIFDKSNHIYHNIEGIPANKSGLRLDTPFIIVDPILLNFNITRNIDETILSHFRILCLKTSSSFKWLN